MSGCLFSTLLQTAGSEGELGSDTDFGGGDGDGDGGGLVSQIWDVFGSDD